MSNENVDWKPVTGVAFAVALAIIGIAWSMTSYSIHAIEFERECVKAGLEQKIELNGKVIWVKDRSQKHGE